MNGTTIDALIAEGQQAAPAADGSLVRRLTDALIWMRWQHDERDVVDRTPLAVTPVVAAWAPRVNLQPTCSATMAVGQ